MTRRRIHFAAYGDKPEKLAAGLGMDPLTGRLAHARERGGNYLMAARRGVVATWR